MKVKDPDLKKTNHLHILGTLIDTRTFEIKKIII